MERSDPSPKNAFLLSSHLTFSLKDVIPENVETPVTSNFVAVVKPVILTSPLTSNNVSGFSIPSPTR